jgi:hypothetical protein
MNRFRRRRVFDGASQVAANTGDRWLDDLFSRVDATLDKSTDGLTSAVLVRRVRELTAGGLTDQPPSSKSSSTVPSRSGPLSVKVMDYETPDGLGRYGFSIEFTPGRGWRVYIMFQPFHQGHDDSLQLPYQARDDTGRLYVDWSEKLDNLADAKTVAALWAEVAQRYQRSRENHTLYVKLIEHYQQLNAGTQPDELVVEERLDPVAPTTPDERASDTPPATPGSAVQPRRVARALRSRRSTRSARRHQ